MNRRHRTGWVSYWTMPTARGQGLASRACRSLTRWAFDEVDLFRLELCHRANNLHQGAVIEGIGELTQGIRNRAGA
ncbi:GNAT family protein [Streptomyces sp. NPDC050619]|uniref:GNAT family N-acetyltransferase n=1 Tax=Streptomyces sp. NPDC050619 TaxID=3157214 RepID=UPI0034314E61